MEKNCRSKRYNNSAYFELDLDLIWDVIKNKLYALKKKIKAILEEESILTDKND